MYVDSMLSARSAPCWVTCVCAARRSWSRAACRSATPLRSTSCGFWTSPSSCPKRRRRSSWSRPTTRSPPRCPRTRCCSTPIHRRFSPDTQLSLFFFFSFLEGLEIIIMSHMMDYFSPTIVSLFNLFRIYLGPYLVLHILIF